MSAKRAEQAGTLFFQGANCAQAVAGAFADVVGMKEEDILKCVTTNAAKAMGKDDWGRLSVGGDATFAIFDTECKGETFSFTDEAGNTASGNIGYKCVLTAINGDIVYVN